MRDKNLLKCDRERACAFDANDENFKNKRKAKIRQFAFDYVLMCVNSIFNGIS